MDIGYAYNFLLAIVLLCTFIILMLMMKGMVIGAREVSLQLESKELLEKAFNTFPVSGVEVASYKIYSLVASIIIIILYIYILSSAELSPGIGGAFAWSCYS